MTTELIQVPPAVRDVTDDLQLVAESPEQMQAAQASLVQWCEAKVSIIQADANELAENLRIALANGWKTDTLRRHHEIAVKRVRFYEKINAAVAAGYCIVPNFPVDVFAIRTTRKTPDRKESRWAGDRRDQASNSPALGQGQYLDPSPLVHQFSQPSGKVDEKTGCDVMELRYFAHSFEDEIEFPISVAKPSIMSAASRAMALKCFDEVGVLPARRKKKQDPVVIGRIIDTSTPQRRAISFMIAWYINTADI